MTIFGVELLIKVSRMGTNKSKLDELSEKILKGMKEASRKLVEESAARGRSLVVSVDGKVKNIPAKELLKAFSK